jgi:hypothetical protein
MMLNNQVEFELEVAELLVCSGFVQPYDLDRAYAGLRGSAGLRDALIEAGAVDTHVWASGVAVINQVREARLPKTEARTALYMVGNCRMSVSEALTKMGYGTPRQNPWLNQLNALRQSGRFEAVS